MRTRGNKLPDFKLHFNMRPTRKEQKDLIASTSKYAKDRIDSLSNILRPVTNIPNVSQINKAKRGKTRLELIPAFKMSDFPPEAQAANGHEKFAAMKKDNSSYPDPFDKVSCANIFRVINLKRDFNPTI